MKENTILNTLKYFLLERIGIILIKKDRLIYNLSCFFELFILYLYIFLINFSQLEVQQGGNDLGKEKILNELKDEISKKVNRLTYENAEEIKEEIQDFLDVIINLKCLRFEKDKNYVSTYDKPLNDNKSIHTNEKESYYNQDQDEGIIGKTFSFSRKLVGGVITDLNGGYLLPEKMVRDMGLEDGDVVKVVGEKNTDDKSQYLFQIEEKSNVSNHIRVEVPFCKVEKEAGEYVVKESLNGIIRFDEIPFTFILQEKDITRLDITVGDIVDVAFYRNNPSTARVTWKHNIKKDIKKTEEERRLVFEDRKPKRDSESSNEKECTVSVELLKDRKILIIGGENRHADYNNAFNQLPFELEMMKGTEDSKRIKAAIERSDATIVIIGEAKHRASILSIQHCKDSGKPFDTTFENGIQSVLLCIENAIKKGIKQGLIEAV